ncbi:4-(cytidine 5'-diphospho)-2-C-methyl-D-erythritol kinase [Kocuria flava]|uniref:GHMP family kinase ATP-binding protein n=1 Tax=Kocuria flava TaxID=446860 RepID=UPI001FF45E3F|nr:4-(cytidine 5'-diphospho)-2-C-methyl-D-erythritol kinase [Kocuria flava]MCJ8506122.1 4-(cytidine 5'-diphospho)-2-C-methyl-D-erythritol kinase [Kocuria flava]
MMLAEQARAPGKVNLFFAAGPPRPDGYHDVASLYCAVSAAETVTATLTRGDGIAVDVAAVPGSLVDQQIAAGTFSLDAVPTGAANLAVRAARAVLERFPRLIGGLHLRLDKAVPVAGGMGGGSADAAAALRAVNRLAARVSGEPALDDDALQHLAAGLGADVPFALAGGAAVGTGTGAQLRPAAVGAPLHLVLVADAAGLSTPAVYAELDRLRAGTDVPPPALPPELEPALARGDLGRAAPLLRNDLQPAALSLAPHLAQTLALGQEAGALASLVSGSGPTVAHVLGGAAAPAALAEWLRARGRPALAVQAP